MQDLTLFDQTGEELPTQNTIHNSVPQIPFSDFFHGTLLSKSR